MRERPKLLTLVSILARGLNRTLLFVIKYHQIQAGGFIIHVLVLSCVVCVSSTMGTEPSSSMYVFSSAV